MSNAEYTPGRWAHSPFPLIETPCGAKSAVGQHGSIYMAHEMAHIHNALLRSLNAIYNQASEVKTSKDITDLLLLTKFWHFEVEDHHSVEEEILFPRLEELTGQKGIMDGNIEQHHAFIPGLEALEKYINETTPGTYNAEKLRSIISSFAMILQQHLHAEIETLLSLKNYDSDRLISCWQAVHEHVLKNCDKNIQLPLFMHSIDRNYEGGVTGLILPWFLHYLVYYLFETKYSRAWRLLPCTTWGQPRPLPFAPSLSKF